MPKENDGRPHYLVVNADESEPERVKTAILCVTSHINFSKGVCWQVSGNGRACCYIYVRGEFIREREALQKAVDEAYDAGLLGKNACGSDWDYVIFTSIMGQGLIFAVRKPR